MALDRISKGCSVELLKDIFKYLNYQKNLKGEMLERVKKGGAEEFEYSTHGLKKTNVAEYFTYELEEIDSMISRLNVVLHEGVRSN